MQKSRKFLVLMLAITAVFALSACGKGNKSEDVEKTTNSKENIKVGVIHIGDPADGSGYSYSHDVGIVQMQQELGLSDNQIIRKNNIADADSVATRTAIEECIEEGCNVIFGTSWGYMDTMEELAQEYPDVMFSHATGYKSNGKNFNNYFGRIYQARYLTGIAAGMKSQSNKIGYVAAMGNSNSEVTSGINAFAMGVESVNPEAKVYVKVTNTWFDPTLEGQAAEALLDLGCDVIAQHQDTTAPQLAAQNRGVWSCGYNSDMSKDAPEAHLTAPVWNWGVYYTKTVKAIMEGTWNAENYFGGMDDGLVDISPISDNCVEGTLDKIEEVKSNIVDGSFKVFEGEIFDNNGNKISSEGEVISDGDITGNMDWYYSNVVVE